jgi:hypothetical protein
MRMTVYTRIYKPSYAVRAIEVLRMKDREDLVEDARDRLIQRLALRQQPGGTNEKS